jgi:hypothetical protein
MMKKKRACHNNKKKRSSSCCASDCDVPFNFFKVQRDRRRKACYSSSNL